VKTSVPIPFLLESQVCKRHFEFFKVGFHDRTKGRTTA
jgi:hypothetical protein